LVQRITVTEIDNDIVNLSLADGSLTWERERGRKRGGRERGREGREGERGGEIMGA